MQSPSARPFFHRFLLPTLLLAASTLAANSCGLVTATTGTGLLVRVEFDAVSVDQLRVLVWPREGGPAVGPKLLPELPTRQVATGETFGVSLPENLVGVLVDIRVEALEGGVVVRRGLAAVVVKRDTEIPLTMKLGLPTKTEPSSNNPGDPGTPDSGTTTTEPTPDSGTDPGVPPDAGNSTPDAGNACLACDGELADGCRDGACVCGTGAACVRGQRCMGGACVCDASSCPQGCCDGALCQPRSAAHCGVSGQSCTSCNPASADVCGASGNCQCGSGPTCLQGQRCVGGACRCDATSCPSGCCDQERCQTGISETACGLGGNLCRTCGPTEQCRSGICGGCGPLTCATGCCANGVCNAPSRATCGLGGGACVACDPVRTDSCSLSRTCACGLGAPCDPGMRCSGGACVCDPATCAGCCAGNACVSGSFLNACGIGGQLCTECSARRANLCINGTCRCGTGPACGSQERCRNNVCVED